MFRDNYSDKKKASENSKEVDRLYKKVRKILKQYGDAPSKEFIVFLNNFNELKKGHEKLLMAIGKL
jgi:hypothetical protein